MSFSIQVLVFHRHQLFRVLLLVQRPGTADKSSRQCDYDVHGIACHCHCLSTCLRHSNTYVLLLALRRRLCPMLIISLWLGWLGQSMSSPQPLCGLSQGVLNRNTKTVCVNASVYGSMVGKLFVRINYLCANFACPCCRFPNR